MGGTVTSTDNRHTRTGPALQASGRLRLAPRTSPYRLRPTPLGFAPATGELIGLAPADGRHHLHILGPTGTGKTVEQLNYCLAQVRAGRGLVVFDPWGDLAIDLLQRLPTWAADRLVLIDPDEVEAPAAVNLLDLDHDPESTTEQVVGVMAKVWAQYWGPRTDDIARHAVLALTHTPGATLADLPILLSDTAYRRRIVHAARARLGPVAAASMDGFWQGFDALPPGQVSQSTGPLLSKLRAVLGRKFAAELLGTATSTFSLDEVLDGGILICRLPKGILGEDTVRLVGSLLLAALWRAAQRRARLAPADRLDATFLIDEAHTFLNLPIGIDTALAESRGLRVSWVLAHQHLGQLTKPMFEAIDANARNKVFFSLSPRDAETLERHVRPYFTADDLIDRDAYGIVVRVLVDGRRVEPFSLNTRPAPPPIIGQEALMRAAARARGLPAADRLARAEARLAGGATGRRQLPPATGNGTGTREPGRIPLPPAPSPPPQRRGDS
jgi:hypothetical protein